MPEWTSEQIGWVRTLARRGMSAKDAANELGMTPENLRKRARRFGISFPRTSAHNGASKLAVSNPFVAKPGKNPAGP